MNDLLLAPSVRLQLEALAQNPPHALLLVGPSGFGKRTIAECWSRPLATPEIIEPDEKNTLSIETVRALYRQTRSRREGRQILIIDHAEAMSGEAQNALLKLLEEPRPDVTFILTAPSPEALLPTITSRTQVITLKPLLATDLTLWLQAKKSSLSAAEAAQYLFIAQGRPGVLATLLQDEAALSAQKLRMQQAKTLLAASQYERLAKINELIKDHVALVAILEAMAVMIGLQLAKTNEAKWQTMAKGLETCLSRLAQNGNPRAQLTHFFLSY
ncbi:MAG TPA: AAA family ATPase [Candidatus Saccharimonadales bacterium]|nr:AAA family ATPase [Candidatus Saccharimonadales bacterium]